MAMLCISSCNVVPSLEEVSDPGQKNIPASTTSPVLAPAVYTIKKGEQYSTNAIKFVSASSMRFEATFDQSAVYTTAAASNQADINKLYGLSDGNTHHHTNSARFGWRWFNNRLEIHAYTYRNMARMSELVDIVELNKPYTYEIRLEDNKYIFVLNDKRVELPRAFTGKGEGYMLYPYFGGDEVAPHDIQIKIKDLK